MNVWLTAPWLMNAFDIRGAQHAYWDVLRDNGLALSGASDEVAASFGIIIAEAVAIHIATKCSE